MHRNIHAIFVTLALVTLILCSGCASQPQGKNTSLQGGLSQVTVPVDTSRISYEEARQKLEVYRTDSINGTADINSIYYIVAKDVDESGNATSWIFGINQGKTANLLIYDKTGWTVFPWSTRIVEKIALGQVITPGTLFSQNKALIVNSTSMPGSERRDLELQHGIYTLTIYSGSKDRILTFNATTGALITQT